MLFDDFELKSLIFLSFCSSFSAFKHPKKMQLFAFKIQKLTKTIQNVQFQTNYIIGLHLLLICTCQLPVALKIQSVNKAYSRKCQMNLDVLRLTILGR